MKPTAINVSAESVLELLGEVHPSPTGDTGNWLSFSQTATVDKCKTTKSALALIGQAAAAHSGPRGAASALSLRPGGQLQHHVCRRPPAVSSLRRRRGQPEAQRRRR